MHPVLVLPFVLLLFGIAILPAARAEWWHKHFAKTGIAIGIAMGIVLVAIGRTDDLLHTMIEYVSFIVLLGSLYTVAGGISLRLSGRSTPVRNIGFLAIGAMLANVIGTTGASLVLIRPFIAHNRYRIAGYHIVFFIFLVSNVGGMLTPIGDPPLFLGYLAGIPFFWFIGHLSFQWIVTIGLILAVFYIIDRRQFEKVQKTVREGAREEEEAAHVAGLGNLFFLGVIVAATFVSDPPFVREIIMIAAGAASYFTTKKEIHGRNNFSFAPIKEIAILFFAIFVTMIPAVDYLNINATAIGITRPEHFFWGTGIFSGILDNAPAFVTFFAAACGLHGVSISSTADVITFVAKNGTFVEAISFAAVAFGAVTYIGNGPNLMVKSIAEHSHITCPHFGEYILKYSLPILVPIFVVVWFVFIR